MRLGDDTELAKLLRELGVELRSKPTETPHVRHLIQLSAELRGPRGNEELGSFQFEEAVAGTSRSGDVSMSVDKWKILGFPEQKAYLQGVLDTLCAVLGIRCSQVWNIDDVLNFGSTVSVAAVKVLSHALLLAAAGAARGGVSTKCGTQSGSEQGEQDEQEERPSILVNKAQGPSQSMIASSVSKEPKKVKMSLESPPNDSVVAESMKDSQKDFKEVPSDILDDADDYRNLALRPDSSGNLVQVETTSIGVFPPTLSQALSSQVVASENAIHDQRTGDVSPMSRGRSRGMRGQQGRMVHTGKKAAQEELQDLWNFGREHSGNRRHLTDQEAEQIKNGFKREARRFVRDEVSSKTRDELFELRMRHNASFRARSQAEAESAAALVCPAGSTTQKGKVISASLSPQRSRGALGTTGAMVTGAGRDNAAARAHAQELRELMYVLKPELKPKAKKAEAADFLAQDFKGILGGATPGKGGSEKARASVKAAPAAVLPAVEEMFKYIESASIRFSDLARILDQNGNGSISLSEFLSGLRSVKYIDEDLPHRSVDSCKRLFATMDKDKSGLVSMKELQAFFEDLSPKRRQVVHEELKVAKSDAEDARVDLDVSMALGNKMKVLRKQNSLQAAFATGFP